jgi:hypothetical protein
LLLLVVEEGKLSSGSLRESPTVAAAKLEWHLVCTEAVAALGTTGTGAASCVLLEERLVVLLLLLLPVLLFPITSEDVVEEVLDKLLTLRLPLMEFLLGTLLLRLMAAVAVTFTKRSMM